MVDFQVPVGGIVLWAAGTMVGTDGFNEYVSSNYVIVDGRVINEPRSPFNGIQLPNMTNKFLAGGSSSGTAVGSNTTSVTLGVNNVPKLTVNKFKPSTVNFNSEQYLKTDEQPFNKIALPSQKPFTVSNSYNTMFTGNVAGALYRDGWSGNNYRKMKISGGSPSSSNNTGSHYHNVNVKHNHTFNIPDLDIVVGSTYEIGSDTPTTIDVPANKIDKFWCVPLLRIF
jgi:hypothetical protein